MAEQIDFADREMARWMVERLLNTREKLGVLISRLSLAFIIIALILFSANLGLISKVSVSTSPFKAEITFELMLRIALLTLLIGQFVTLIIVNRMILLNINGIGYLADKGNGYAKLFSNVEDEADPTYGDFILRLLIPSSLLFPIIIVVCAATLHSIALILIVISAVVGAIYLFFPLTWLQSIKTRMNKHETSEG